MGKSARISNLSRSFFQTFEFSSKKGSYINKIYKISIGLGLSHSLFSNNDNKLPSYIDQIHNLPHKVRSVLQEHWKSDDSDSDNEGFELSGPVDSDDEDAYHEDSGRLQESSDSDDDDFVTSERSDKSDTEHK